MGNYLAIPAILVIRSGQIASPTEAPVEETLHRSFGYIVAYILPGLVALWAASLIWTDVPISTYLDARADVSASGWFFLIFGSLGIGLIVSSVRWLLVDTIHHRTGLTAPRIDFSRLQDRQEAFLTAVEHNYRYYQFYANLFVSLVFALFGSVAQVSGLWSAKTYAAVVSLSVLLFVASRDCLRRYYVRLGQVLGQSASGKHKKH